MGVPCFEFPQGYRGPELYSWPDAYVEVPDVIFVLGRREDACCNCGPCNEARSTDPSIVCNVGRYHLQGIFTEESLAVAAAIDETYFVGPLPVNMALPHRVVEWAGLYFPHAAQIIVRKVPGCVARLGDLFRDKGDAKPVTYQVPVGRRPGSLFLD